jgi:hypothetical protein
VTREPPCSHAGEAQSHFCGVRPRDHYMPLQRLTLDHMSCFATGFPLLGTIEYPQAPFTIAKFSPYWVQQNTLRPLLHLVALYV